MEICEYNQCTGCGACKTICPIQCIRMEQDNEGFLRPIIDEDKCIRCKKCVRSCPSNNFESQNFLKDRMQAYAFWHANSEVLKKSASGGAFSAFAEEILSNHGVIFGAAYDEEFNVAHTSVSNIKDLSKLRDSKYVESDTKDTYLQAKKILEAGKEVLYVGTPCQIAGLYAALDGKNYNNLYTIDLLCHGVPSSKLFSEYIKNITKDYGKLIHYSFRDKSKWGWGNWGSFTYVDKKSNKIKKKNFIVATDYFYSLFFKECILRENCYQCKYASIPRVADVTIGDCWGIEEFMPQIDNKNGVSLILVNSEQGNKLLKTISQVNLKDLYKISLDEAIKYNKTIILPTNRPKEREDFYKNFNKYGFDKTARMYCSLKKSEMLSLYLPRKLKIKIKRILKRIRVNIKA